MLRLSRLKLGLERSNKKGDLSFRYMNADESDCLKPRQPALNKYGDTASRYAASRA
jgi:hypothetical protein